MKNHTIIYISPQTPYLGKFWFASYGANALNQSDYKILSSVLFQERSEGSS